MKQYERYAAGFARKGTDCSNKALVILVCLRLMNALVTGASKGIGKAIACQLAANNYNLVLCARHAAALESLAAQLQKQYPTLKIYTLLADCEQQQEVKALANWIDQHFPVLDVLVNNVGLYIPGPLLDEPTETLQRQMQVNVYAAHYLSIHFGRKMRSAKKGHIFNLCSTASIEASPTSGSYGITKATLLSLTKALRQELMGHQVKVTAILPGSTWTDSWAGTPHPPDKFIDPKDIASALITCLKMSTAANVDEILIRPLEGNIGV